MQAASDVLLGLQEVQAARLTLSSWAGAGWRSSACRERLYTRSNARQRMSADGLLTDLHAEQKLWADHHAVHTKILPSIAA